VPGRWETAKPEEVIRASDRGLASGVGTTEEIIEAEEASPEANAERFDGTDDVVRPQVVGKSEGSGTASTPPVATLAEVQKMISDGTSGWQEDGPIDSKTSADRHMTRLRRLSGIAPAPLPPPAPAEAVSVTDLHVGALEAMQKNSGVVAAARLALASERQKLASEVDSAERTSGYSLGELLMLTKVAMDTASPSLAKDAFLDAFPAIAEEVCLDLEAAAYATRAADGSLDMEKCSAAAERMRIRDQLDGSPVDMESVLAKSAAATAHAFETLVVRERAQEILVGQASSVATALS